MKKSILLITLFVSLLISVSCRNQKPTDSKNQELNNVFDTAHSNNDFYDDEQTFALNIADEIEIAGEVAVPCKIKLSKLQKHSVIVKEALLSGDSNAFTGAYRYDGYSLYDILKQVKLQKANEEDFPPIIDLFVIIENDKGEKVVISWGEIYYPVHRHEIIIASDVMRIVPSKTKEQWELPTVSKLVIASDLLSERNISKPVKITVTSHPAKYEVNKDMKPLYSEDINIYNEDKLSLHLKGMPENMPEIVYNTIFYGRGRGIHSTQPFNGVIIRDILQKYFPVNKENLQKAYFVFVAKDGYRCVYSFSEIMNRSDQAELLLIPDLDNKDDGGAFRIFPAADFFSDRAVKAVSQIKLIKI